MRKEILASGSYYHILNRSIAKFLIYNDNQDYERMQNIINLYRFDEFNYKYSYYEKLSIKLQRAIYNDLNKDKALVDIVAYCIMPTHFHLILKQNEDSGIIKYVSRISNSYTRYFNLKHKRRGPLWEGHFKNILVQNNEQLLHLTRYIHLNPVSAGLIEKPEDWTASSYLEYLDLNKENSICNYEGLFNITPQKYKKFVDDRKSYQREISKIKKILNENYSG